MLCRICGANPSITTDGICQFCSTDEIVHPLPPLVFHDDSVDFLSQEIRSSGVLPSTYLPNSRLPLVPSFSIGIAQKQHYAWVQRQPFWNADWQDPLMGITEEVGELNHALLKQKQGIRGTYAEHEDAAKDAVGDIFIYMMDLCNRRDWDLETIFQQTWNKVMQRDWKKDSKSGGE